MMLRNYKIICKIITHLFMGGAKQQAELRTQSINGILRWWFRVAGGSLDDEKKLFGWAGEKSNQGLVRIHVSDFENLRKDIFSKKFDNRGRVVQESGINYLGFALDQRFREDDREKERREYIIEDQKFTLQIRFYPLAEEDDIKKLFCALWLAFNLGNFGSRSRRGFGSIKIEKIEHNRNEVTNDCFGLSFTPQNDLENWIKENLGKIKKIINGKPREDIPFIFGNGFEIYRIEKNNFSNYQDWRNQIQSGRNGRYLVRNWIGRDISSLNDLLDFMGFLLMAFRSYRAPDYQNAKNLLQHRGGDTILERSIFGLPLNFYFSSINKKGMVHLKSIKSSKETLRRASPLMIKIIETNNNYEGLFIVLKSKFMPNASYLDLNGVRVQLPQNQWQALDDFIRTLSSYSIIRRLYP